MAAEYTPCPPTAPTYTPEDLTGGPDYTAEELTAGPEYMSVNCAGEVVYHNCYMAGCPEIEEQPEDVEVSEGDPAVFTIVTDFDDDATYQWQILTLGWSDVTDGMFYTGATTSELTVTSVTEDMDGNSFRCLVSFEGCETLTSDIATLTVLGPPPPDAPTNLVATTISSSEIDLTWDFDGDAAGFIIEHSNDGVLFSFLADVSGGDRSYAVTGLEPNTTHYYRIYAYNDAGNSAFSNTADATTSGDPVPAIGPGFIEWDFGGTSFTVTPQSVIYTAGIFRLTFASEWSLHAGGSIPLHIYNDAGYTSPYGSEFNGNANPSGGPVIQTVDLPVTGGYIIQTNTNFVGNYTAPGDNGSTGFIYVYNSA